MKDSDVITVCDKCFRACCWQGVFMCEESYGAGTVEKTVGELKKLSLEHSDYWKDELDMRVPGEECPLQDTTKCPFRNNEKIDYSKVRAKAKPTAPADEGEK